MRRATHNANFHLHKILHSIQHASFMNVNMSASTPRPAGAKPLIPDRPMYIVNYPSRKEFFDEFIKHDENFFPRPALSRVSATKTADVLYLIYFSKNRKDSYRNIFCEIHRMDHRI